MLFITLPKKVIIFASMHEILTLSLLESIMETCSVVLTFESVDEILWCDHSNETSSAVLLHGTIFSLFYKILSKIFYKISSKYFSSIFMCNTLGR